jgi:hypothetical protein
MDRLKYILESIKINYKFWIVLWASLFVISSENNLDTIITFIVIMSFFYFIHLINHIWNIYPLNAVHLYHHDHDNWFSYIMEIVLEFIWIISFIIGKLSLKALFNINFAFLNSYLIIFFYLIYTTVHNINYSIFHVNNVHEYHHKDQTKNIGPDICDLVYGTKHNSTHNIENTDHYLPNIIGSLLLVLFLKYINTLINNNLLITNITILLYTLLSIVLFYGTYVIIFYDIDKYFEDNYSTFTRNK